MNNNTTLKDPWTNTFVDTSGIIRCTQCKHARPSVYQTSNSQTQASQTATNPQDGTNE